MAQKVIVAVALISFAGLLIRPASVIADTIPLTSISPKLQAIHEDAKSLLIKNSELKSQILVGLQAQNEARLKLAKEAALPEPVSTEAQPPKPASPQDPKLATMKPEDKIDYAELEEFNKWVEVNLEYAVKNTQASIEALKEEAQLNSGNVDYSEQAIKDGIEGVKYWQSAVIFQDKTLKHEKFDVE